MASVDIEFVIDRTPGDMLTKVSVAGDGRRYTWPLLPDDVRKILRVLREREKELVAEGYLPDTAPVEPREGEE